MSEDLSNKLERCIPTVGQLSLNNQQLTKNICLVYLLLIQHFVLSSPRISTTNSHLYFLDNTQMIEADVTFCSVPNLTNGKEAVMSHDSCSGDIDLTLEQFLLDIITAIDLEDLKKGVKLDFKDGESMKYAFEKILISNCLFPKINFPLWINADIIPGPRGVNDEKLSRKRKETKQVLNLNGIDGIDFSLGWSTGEYDNLDSSKYTNEQINEMKEFVKDSWYSITFPVRAMYAANSLEEMKALLQVGTLTIWSAKQDTQFVNIPKLKELIAYDYKFTRIYVDIPEDLRKLLSDI